MTKRILAVGGGVAGVGVPAWSFFSSYPPPLFPGVTLITAALSVAIWAIVSKGPKSGRPSWRIIAAVALLSSYIVLLQFTTLPIPPDNDNRVQIGFGTENWTLTNAGQGWKEKYPLMTAYEIANRESAFDQQRVPIVWRAWSVYVSGISLIVLYFVGFALWTAGFAILGIGGPQ
ncbi:MAG: hypothetical protein V7609_3295 [Verrucomicrobiota bacterium]